MKTIMLTTALVIWGGAAMAVVTTEALVADLQAQGYSWIEVKQGPTQIKVEAVKGTVKVETVYDIATGAVIESETERASVAEQGRTGVEVRTRDRDFEDGRDDDSGRDDDDSDDRDDDHGGRGDDDDHDDDHGGRDDDDRDDDRGRGGDDERGSDVD
jgi:hypothetical protein